MENKKISVIVPVCNEEKSIKACISSIIEQEYENLEIIIVYKESQDKTLEIINSIQDSRIKLIKQELNNGPGGARNLGILNSTGDYIGFVESSKIDKDFYKKLYKQITEESCDIAISQIDFIKDENKIKTLHHPFKKRNITKLSEKLSLMRNGACFNKLFKSSLIKDNNINFVEGYRWEDNPFILKALFYSKKITLLSDCTYPYDVSSEWSDSYKKILKDSIIPITEIMMNFAKCNNFSWIELQKLKKMIFKSYACSFITEDDIYNTFKSVIGFSPYITYRYWRLRFKEFKRKRRNKNV